MVLKIYHYIERTFFIGFLLFFGFFVDANPRVVEEFSKVVLLFFAIVFVVFHFTKLKAKKSTYLNYFTFVLFVYSVVSTVQSINNIVETDIIRLKLLFKIYLVLYILFITILIQKKYTKLEIGIVTLFYFTSFPYAWSLTIGSLRSVIPMVFAVFLFLEAKREESLTSNQIVFFSIKNDAFIYLLVFSFIGVNLFSDNYFRSNDVVFKLLCSTFLYYLVQLKSISTKRIIDLLIFIFLFNIIYIFLGILSFSFTHPGFDFISLKKTSISGINVNDISGYLIILLPILVARFIDLGKITTKQRIFFGILILCNILLTVLIKSRTAWFAQFFSFFMFLFLIYRNKKRDKRNVLAIVLLLLIFIISLFAIYIFSENVLQKETLMMRYHYWKISIAAIKENFFLGITADNYAYITSFLPIDGMNQDFSLIIDHFRRSGLFHTHNLFLQLWLDGGFVYVLSFMLILLFSLWNFYKKGFSTHDFLVKFSISISILSTIIQGFLNYNFFHYPILFAFWVMVGLLNHYHEKQQAPKAKYPRLVVNIFLFILLVWISYHSVAIFYKSKAYKEIKNIRYKNPGGSVLLKESSNTKDDLKAVGNSILYVQKSLVYYPKNSELNQLLGELYYFRYSLLKDKSDLLKSQKNYYFCTNTSDLSSFCYLRLAEVSKILYPESIDKYDQLIEKSSKLDPMELNTKGNIVPF